MHFCSGIFCSGSSLRGDFGVSLPNIVRRQAAQVRRERQSLKFPLTDHALDAIRGGAQLALIEAFSPIRLPTHKWPNLGVGPIRSLSCGSN